MTFINTLSRKKLSMISGLLVGLSYPPGFGIIALFSLVPLMRVWLTSSPRSSLKYSFLSSIVCSMISLYWIGLNSGASIVPVIMSLVAAILYLSIFWIITGYSISWMKKKYSKTIYVIPFLWVGMEFLKSYGPLAFPWSNLALTQTNFLPVLQIIDYTGSEGVSFWVILVNITIYLILYEKQLKFKQYSILTFLIITPILYGLIKNDFLVKLSYIIACNFK